MKKIACIALAFATFVSPAHAEEKFEPRKHKTGATVIATDEVIGCKDSDDFARLVKLLIGGDKVAAWRFFSDKRRQGERCKDFPKGSSGTVELVPNEFIVCVRFKGEYECIWSMSALVK